MTPEDSEALTSVLHSSHPSIDSQYSFYLYAANLFQNISTHYEVFFSRLAIQVAPADADTASLWRTVVKGLTDLALYGEAYATTMATPFEKEYVVPSCRYVIAKKRGFLGKENAVLSWQSACANKMR